MEFGNFDVFAAKDEVAQQGRVLTLDTEKIYADPDNVRQEIDRSEITSLAETISQRGQLQPIIVGPADSDGRHMVQFGERRWLACRQLGVEVRAIVREAADPMQVRIDQFIENDQREQLSTRDIVAFVAGQLASGVKSNDLARAIGRDKSTVSRLAKLATAPDFIVSRFDDVPARGAVALMTAADIDEEATKAFVDGAPVGSLTVAICEKFVREIGDGEGGRTDAPTSSSSTDNTQRETSPRKSPVDPGSIERARFGQPGRMIEVEGKRARMIEALLHFEGEPEPRLVRFAD